MELFKQITSKYSPEQMNSFYSQAEKMGFSSDLINQVKPLFGNFKSVINVVKGFRNKNTSPPKIEPKKTVNNTNNITSETTNSNEYIQENYQFTPNKPYFS